MIKSKILLTDAVHIGQPAHDERVKGGIVPPTQQPVTEMALWRIPGQPVVLALALPMKPVNRRKRM